MNWKRQREEAERNDDRRFHRRLPASWPHWVGEQAMPVWVKGLLLWLLDVPRWIYFTLVSVLVVGTMAFTIAAVSIYNYLSKPVPIPIPVVAAATETGHIFAADGSLLADLHGPINRQSVPLAQMTTALRQAALAADAGTYY